MGSIGVGLVWGWLLGGREPVSRSTLLVFVAATLVLAGEVQLLAAWPEPPLFVGSTAVAAWGHLAWRRVLRRRYRPSN